MLFHIFGWLVSLFYHFMSLSILLFLFHVCTVFCVYLNWNRSCFLLSSSSFSFIFCFLSVKMTWDSVIITQSPQTTTNRLSYLLLLIVTIVYYVLSRETEHVASKTLAIKYILVRSIKIWFCWWKMGVSMKNDTKQRIE